MFTGTKMKLVKIKVIQYKQVAFVYFPFVMRLFQRRKGDGAPEKEELSIAWTDCQGFCSSTILNVNEGEKDKRLTAAV